MESTTNPRTDLPEGESPSELVSTEALRTAVASSAKAVENKERALQELESELESARREHRLLAELLSLRGETAAHGSVVERDVTQLPLIRREDAVDDPVSDAAVEFLREVGQPTHIGEIFTNLVDRNVEIPGAGDQANVILRLRNDSRITRTSRGIYGLKAWNLPEYAPKPRRGKKKSRKEVR